MEQTGTVKLAKVLKILMTIVFACNIVALFMLPIIVAASTSPDLAGSIARNPGPLFGALPMIYLTMPSWGAIYGEYGLILLIFLFFCGICTAITVWQARGVLRTVVRQDTFTKPNAKRMKIAAICFLLISIAALGRTIWGFLYYKSMLPLFTYNALFIPIFLIAGLLCMVMSALFRQAAELKEENDLTI